MWKPVNELRTRFRYDVHVYSTNPSYRCFHVEARIDAEADPRKKWDGVIDLTEARKGVTLFYPFTTTLVEISLDREPLPLSGPNRLVRFPG